MEEDLSFMETAVDLGKRFFVQKDTMADLGMDLTRKTIAHLMEDQDAAREIFLGAVLEKFDRNEHRMDCHTPENRVKLAAKLRANPEKLDALRRMDESGGEPDLTEVDGENFIFDDCFTTAPASRKALTYEAAEAEASAMGGGSKLMGPMRYLALARKGLVLGSQYEWNWLNSSGRADLLQNGLRFCGARPRDRRRNVLLRVEPVWLSDSPSFRCTLRV